MGLLAKVRRLEVDGPLDGMRVSDLVRVLGRNHLRHAQAPGLPAGTPRRRAKLALIALRNSLLAAKTQARFGAAVQAAQVKAPLFVTGYWRSGTTHLHNLLCQDDRFAAPNHYEVYHPHTFLLTEDRYRAAHAGMGEQKRAQDNVLTGAFTPAEDEFAMPALTNAALYLGAIFPVNTERYHRFQTLAEATPDELADWRAAFSVFLKRLSVRYPGRRLILKSPAHTGRIRHIRGIFPDAKFLHIHRDPYEVFRSAEHWSRTLAGGAATDADTANVDAVLRSYVEIHEAFFRDREHLPPDCYCEVAFTDLERDPVGEMRRVYQTLGLPSFDVAEPAMRSYLATISTYQKNRHHELPPELRARIAAAWRRCFDAWGYPTEPRAPGSA
jgi:omega-hydroxy-beta-dihydromenaquinone-9 sulfotransferase